MTRTRTTVAGGVSLAELRVWMLLVAGFAYWGNVVRTARSDGAAGLGYVLDGVLQNGAFAAASWALIVAWAAGAGPARRASAGQIAAAAALCLLGAMPSRQTAILVLIGLGVQLARPAGTRTGRKVAVLLFALAFDSAWTSPYLLALHAAVATLDARAVQGLLHAAGVGAGRYGNLIAGATPGFGIEILARCASSYPFGGVCLAFVVTLLYQGRFPRRRDLPWLVASLAASVVLTEVRLSWMALGDADYLWLHEGSGVTLYTLAAVACAVLFPLLAARGGGRAGGSRVGAGA